MIISKYKGQRKYWKDLIKEYPRHKICFSDYRDLYDLEKFNGVVESIVTTMKEKAEESERLQKEGKKIYWNNTSEEDTPISKYMTEEESEEMQRRLKIVKALNLGIFDYDGEQNKELEALENKIYEEYICNKEEVPKQLLEELKSLQ